MVEAAIYLAESHGPLNLNIFSSEQIGERFTISRAATLARVRVRTYNEDGAVKTGTMRLWRVSDQALLMSATISGGTSEVWQEADCPDVALSPGTEYVLSVQNFPVRYLSVTNIKASPHGHTVGDMTASLPYGGYHANTAGDKTGYPSPTADSSTEFALGMVLVYNDPPGSPGAFTSPAGGATVNTAATVTFGAATDPNGDVLTYDVDLSTNNGATWTAIRGNQPGTSFSYDFTSQPATTTAVLRARTRDTSAAISGYTTGPTFTIQHNVAPTAPTNLSPAGGQSIDRATPQRLSWQFNDPDVGDSQSKYDLQYRIGSGAWTVITGITPNAFRDFPGGTFVAGTYEWQVRTYDALGLFSPYSTSGFFTAADVPNVPTITSPVSGATISTSTGSVAWSAPSQEAYKVRKVADNAGAADTLTVYFDSGEVLSTTARDAALTFPVNGRHEHLQVRVRVSGLWSSWGSVRVLVSYTPPAVPSVVVTADSAAGLIRVLATHPAPAGSEPTVASMDVRRREGSSGDGIRIAAAVAPGVEFVDRTPASGVAYQYSVVAHGSNSTSTSSLWTA